MGYELVWSEVPLQQYNSLPASVRLQIDEAIQRILEDPEGQGSYDKSSDMWSATFASGLILYVVSRAHIRVVILRIVAL